MILLKPYSILVYNDGPQLFYAEDKIGVKYVCMEVDSNADESLYVAITISTKKIKKLNEGKIDLRLAFEKPETEVWYRLVFDGQSFVAEQFSFTNIAEEYLPLSGFYIPDIVPTPDNVYQLIEEKHSEVAFNNDELVLIERVPRISRYVEMMRKNAIYFTLKPAKPKFGETIDPKDAAELLELIPKSFKEYCRNNFYLEFKASITDLKRLEDTFKDAWEYLRLRICDLKFSSFNVGLSADVMVDRDIDKNINNWKDNIVEGYKNDVIDYDFLSDKDASLISERFPDDDIRRRIFEPIIKIIENPSTSLIVSDKNNLLEKTLKIGRKQKDIIIHTKENLPDPDLIANRQIVHMYFEVPENRTLTQSFTKKLFTEGLLFSQVTNEFPIVIDRITNGNTLIELNTQLFLHAFLERDLYRIDIEELDIHIQTSNKEDLHRLFSMEFIEKYKQYINFPESKHLLEYNKIVKSYVEI